MNLNRFTQKSIDAISEAQSLAQNAEHPQVTPEHLLKALLQQDNGLVPQVIKKLGADLNALTLELDNALDALPRQTGGQVYPSNDLSQILLKSEKELKQFKDEYVSVEHLLLAMLEVKCKATEALKAAGVTRTELIKALTSIRGATRVTDADPGVEIRRARKIHPRPDRGRPRREARPGDRPRRRNPSHHQDSLASHQEQPGADRRARNRQDGGGRRAWRRRSPSARCRKRSRTVNSWRSTWAR